MIEVANSPVPPHLALSFWLSLWRTLSETPGNCALDYFAFATASLHYPLGQLEVWEQLLFGVAFKGPNHPNVTCHMLSGLRLVS